MANDTPSRGKTQNHYEAIYAVNPGAELQDALLTAKITLEATLNKPQFERYLQRKEWAMISMFTSALDLMFANISPLIVEDGLRARNLSWEKYKEGRKVDKGSYCRPPKKYPKRKEGENRGRPRTYTVQECRLGPEAEGPGQDPDSGSDQPCS